MGFVPNLPAELMKDQSFIEDLARFAEGVLTEKQVRQKWHYFDEAEWTTLGQSDELVERIELEKTRRIRSGATKKELARLHVIKGPAILDSIASDPKVSPRHKVDAIKALDQLAGFGSEAAHDDVDRFIIRIDLSADTKDPKDVLVFETSSQPKTNANIIDSTAQELEAIPPKRARGRPKGSKNKVKIEEELLPLVAANKPTTDGGNGNTL